MRTEKAKKGAKALLFSMLLIFVFLAGGCETAKCIRSGKCYPAEGIPKDIKNCWNSFNAWFKECWD